MIAKKSFGQNFLSDHNIIKKIIIAAKVKLGEIVLEIGPGQGSLTSALIEAGAQVVSVEADQDLIQPLQEKFGNKIKLIYGDILSPMVWKRIKNIIGKKKYSVVANIPYNITSLILETLFKAVPKPTRLTLMVQKEVADRILAKPPKTSVLSIACQLYTTGYKALQVSRGAFRPVPKVDSTVVCLDLLPVWVGGVDPEKVLTLVKVGFSARRKQLYGNLVRAKVCPQEKILEIFKKMGLNEKVRAENLTPEQWVEFYLKSIHT